MAKILLLYNLNRGNNEHEAEFDSQMTIDALTHSLSIKNTVFAVEAIQDFSWINKVIDINPDLIFNICEGFCGPARESVYAAILDQLSYNYSGPDSTNLLICHNKIMVKRILEKTICVPKGICISSVKETEAWGDVYPAIIKLNSEGSSIGINEHSIVNSKTQLINQVQFLMDTYHENILVEEYIDGRDLSMIYVEGLGALGPCIVDCPAEIYNYEMKTIKDRQVSIYNAEGNYMGLKEIVLKIAEVLDLKGYAKIDFRERNGEFYLIEVNAQVSFHPLGEFVTCANKSGFDFDLLINHIVDYALQQKHKYYSKGIYGGDW